MVAVPKSGTVTYAEWLHMPAAQDGREEVVNREIRKMRPISTVEIDIARIWPD